MGRVRTEPDVRYEIYFRHDGHPMLHPTRKIPLKIPGVYLPLIHVVEHLCPVPLSFALAKESLERLRFFYFGPLADCNVVMLPGPPPRCPSPDMGIS